MFGYYLNLALRSFRRNKALTALMVLAIALGIGASMTTLTVFHVLSGDPIPQKSDRLFYVQMDPEPMRGYRPARAGRCGRGSGWCRPACRPGAGSACRSRAPTR